MSKILTVSVAAYNVEKYLDQTLASLNDARFLNDIEVLVVDDGSMDGTADIALKYQAMAPDSFKYIAKENGGHGSTINKGLELAHGKYFRVLDGDDWVERNGFAEYIYRLKQSDADMVLTQCKIIKDNDETYNLPIKNLTDGKVYRWEEIDEFAQIGLSIMTIKTNLLRDNNIKITEKCYYVDIEYTVWSLFYADTIMYMGIPLYMYRKSNVSQSTSKKNMVRNVGMQERVAGNVCRMYSAFLKENHLCESKDQAIYKRVAQSIGSTFRTYLLLPDKNESAKRIKEFDNEVKKISPVVFEKLGKGQFVKLMRWGNYMLVPVLRIIYRIYILKH